ERRLRVRYRASTLTGTKQVWLITIGSQSGSSPRSWPQWFWSCSWSSSASPGGPRLQILDAHHPRHDEHRPRDAARRDRLLRQAHQGEVVEDDRAEELPADDEGDEGGRPEALGQCGAGQDDQCPERTANPVPPLRRAERFRRRRRGTEDDHCQYG